MSGFDRLAKPYRWMEYLSFGTALENCRFHFLPVLRNTRHALLLGDGDGRFTAALLRQATAADAVAIDASGGMLHALKKRCAAVGAERRIQTFCTALNNGLSESLPRNHFDLIVTHFFLDCLNDAEVEHIAHDAALCATADARWVISDFHIPDHGAMRLPSRLIVRLLYLAFRLLTGLRAQQLPTHGPILHRNGWQMQQQQTSLGGLLISELWQRADNANIAKSIKSELQ
ncbi:class I SAM-dependent methyltransferase [Terriglobus roseus]|uniref:Methyltransferase domain-containing protein n=1 Tax=Terriglobus roseus TaxID=392734 RepID=A0A1G7F3C5_9BACT|nr:class I SAM-dependent methyltransferase [Terriglobus roseus]SDE70389.1 Methyltransferase domain-containing protein [Terriglobus roseus]